MLKVSSFLTKREGMEVQALIDYYENSFGRFPVTSLRFPLHPLPCILHTSCPRLRMRIFPL